MGLFYSVKVKRFKQENVSCSVSFNERHGRFCSLATAVAQDENYRGHRVTRAFRLRSKISRKIALRQQFISIFVLASTKLNVFSFGFFLARISISIFPSPRDYDYHYLLRLYDCYYHHDYYY